MALQAVCNQPVVAAINADAPGFQSANGVDFFAANCTASTPNHAVTIVGYGTEGTSQDYWIIRNSWGNDWGISGHIKVPRGVNWCGIANNALYPLPAQGEARIHEPLLSAVVRNVMGARLWPAVCLVCILLAGWYAASNSLLTWICRTFALPTLDCQ